FNSITLSELPRLSCGTSLLIDFEGGDDHLDWEVKGNDMRVYSPIDSVFGKQAVCVLFTDESELSRFSTNLPSNSSPEVSFFCKATYLPEVAEEQGWAKEEAIDSLLRKGGNRWAITESVRGRIILTRYQSAKAKRSHADYWAWKEKRKA
ncbi:hypothetical protein BJ742DRAFT_672178, partial [Cladochytrium replicatum]